MARGRIQNKRVENNTSRQQKITFCKRCNGLLKKAYDELAAVICYAVMALIVVFSSCVRQQQQMFSLVKWKSFWTLLAVGSFLLWSVVPVESASSSDDAWQFYCGNETFTKNGHYDKILNNITEKLPAQVSTAPSYFLYVTPYDTEEIYAMGKCREDSSPTDCETCIRQAFQGVGARCPLKKVAAIVYDMCSLWISYTDFMDTGNFDGGISFLRFNNSRGPVESEFLGKIVYGLVWAVAAETVKSMSSFAVAQQEIIGTNGSTLYAFAQCIPTVTRSDCEFCLSSIIATNLFLSSVGGESCDLRCQFRWELYPFIRMTPTPAEGKHGSSSQHQWKRNFIILCAVIGSAVLATLIVWAIVLSVQWWRHSLTTTPTGERLERVETTSSEKKCLETGEGSLSKVPEMLETPKLVEQEMLQTPKQAIGDACARMDLGAIHEILVRTHYKDDEGSTDELSFEGWTQHDVLHARKRGDSAFESKEFRIAINGYTEFVNAATTVSPTVHARRSLCYLMCDDPQAALRDALIAQSIKPEWPTAFFMQSVALSKMDMHNDALDMLNEASQLEERRRQKNTE